MKSSSRLLLFALLFATVAGCAFYLSQYLLNRYVTGPVNYHYWIHNQLRFTPKQESDLEPIEAKFAKRRDELVTVIRQANRELAEALLADKADSQRVKTAVQKIHSARGELQQAVLDHVFEMRPVLTQQQYNRLIQLTAEALRDTPELR